MASFIQTLASSKGTESAGFLNDIIAQLWPNINVAGSRIAKEVVEPMFAAMLPGPLSSLRFAKLDLGPVPIKFSAVEVHKIDSHGIKLDLDLDWDGRCDIDLEGTMVPRLGVEHMKLKGRLSVLLCPLTDVIPLIGAAQVSFINPPSLQLDFTDAANIADCKIIEKAVRKVIINIISSMAVLPNRFLVKLDPCADYFKAYQHHVGVLRVTIEKADGITAHKKTGIKGFLDKIAKDIPDCYCKVSVGAEEVWRTSTKKNDFNPVWNETHDFLVMDDDQCIALDVQDDDLAGDDDIGVGLTSVRQILLAGGSQEISLTHEGQPSAAKVRMHAKFHNLVADAASFSSAESQGEGRICGLATILIASALSIPGQPEDLNPSVKVTWGTREFNTASKSYSPGVDIFNPSFDSAFTIPLTTEMVANPASFKIALMNKNIEFGFTEIPFEEVLAAPDMVRADTFDMGSGAKVRASITVRGTRLDHH